MLEGWEEFPPRICCKESRYWRGDSFICVSLLTRLAESSRPLLKEFPSRSPNGPSPEPRIPAENDRMLGDWEESPPSTSISPSVVVEPLGAARALASSSVLPLRNQPITSRRLAESVRGGPCPSQWMCKDIAS